MARKLFLVYFNHGNYSLPLGEPHSFRRFTKEKRYAILVAYLLHLTQDLIDQAFEIHDRQIMTLQSKGRRAQEELQKKNGKSVNEKVIHYARLGEALIKAREEELDPFTTLETIMPWEKFITSIEEAKDLSRPINYDYLDLLENRFFTCENIHRLYYRHLNSVRLNQHNH